MSSYYKIAAKSMGRRELFIALSFVIAGIVVYLVSAPPPDTAVSKRSLPALVDQWREAGRRTAARGSLQNIGSIPLRPQVSEVRVTGFAELHILGEPRQDIAWTLDVEAMGPTVEAAKATAAATVVGSDDLGDTLAISPRVPEEARVSLALTLKVPARLAGRIENVNRTEATGLASLRLENLVGDVTIKTIAGKVSGSHRNGALTVDDSGSVTMSLNGSRAALTNVRGELTLSTRNGECQVTGSGGPVSIDASNATTTVDRPTSTVRVNATGGAVRISSPRETVHVDARRGRVDLDLDAPAPISVLGAETPVTVSWRGVLPITVDAVSTDGTIMAADFGLTAEQQDKTARLIHEFGSRARVTVRTTRSSIVIAQRK